MAENKAFSACANARSAIHRLTYSYPRLTGGAQHNLMVQAEFGNNQSSEARLHSPIEGGDLVTGAVLPQNE